MFKFQFHPRREIVADETDTEQNNSDEKKSDSEQRNSDEKKSDSKQRNSDEKKSDSEHRISDEKNLEVIVKELEDTLDSPQTLNGHQEEAQVHNQPVTSIKMQSILLPISKQSRLLPAH